MHPVKKYRQYQTVSDAYWSRDVSKCMTDITVKYTEHSGSVQGILMDGLVLLASLW